MLDSLVSRSSKYTSGAGIKIRSAAGKVMTVAKLKPDAAKIAAKMNSMRLLMKSALLLALICSHMSLK